MTLFRSLFQSVRMRLLVIALLPMQRDGALDRAGG
jgi:hypothetical protein